MYPSPTKMVGYRAADLVHVMLSPEIVGASETETDSTYT